MVALVAATLSACGPSQSDTQGGGVGADGRQKIVVGTLPIASSAALHLGIEKGFFADEGLDVSEQSIPNSAGAMAAVQGGQVQFAYTPSMPMFIALSQGIELKAVAAADGYPKGAYDQWIAAGRTTNPDDTAVLVREDSDIKSPRDLEGKVVAVPSRRTQLEITTARAVEEDGGDPTKINWIALSFQDMIPTLEAGRVDAIAEVSPFVQQAKSQGARVLTYPGIGTFREGAVGLWIGASTFVEANPDVAKRFATAMNKANDYANSHIDEAYAKAAEVTKISVDILKSGARPYWPNVVEPGDLDRAAQAMKDLGYLNETPTTDSLVVR
jgi:NitT/TauT family transport system substrate-binding protein